MSIYRSFIKTYGIAIIMISLIGTISGVLAIRLLPTTYDVLLSLSINRQDEISDQFYSYDGYYAIQAEEEFSKTVSMWFISPDFVEQIFGLVSSEEASELGVKDFRRIFSAEQVSANQVEVVWNVTTPDRGKAMTRAIDQVIKDRIQAQKLEEYEIYLSEPVIKETQHTRVFWALGGFILSGGFSVAGFALKEYLK